MRPNGEYVLSTIEEDKISLVFNKIFGKSFIGYHHRLLKIKHNSDVKAETFQDK